MARQVTRFGGLLLIAAVLVGGVVVGRVIEAIGVAAVLFAVWFWVQRLLAAPDDEATERGSADWS